MIEKIAAVEGGLQEETTYDGRKLRWSEDARKGLWTMKNAYQRRRVKARVEKRARMTKLDAITLDFARQVIEEETGSAARDPASRPTDAKRRQATDSRPAERGQARCARRQEEPADLDVRLDGRRRAADPARAGRFHAEQDAGADRGACAGARRVSDRPCARRGGHRDRQEDDGRDDRDLLTRVPPSTGPRTPHARRAVRHPRSSRRLGSTARGESRCRGVRETRSEPLSLLPHGRHRASRRRAESLLVAALSRRAAHDAGRVQAVDPRPAGLVQQLHGRLLGLRPDRRPDRRQAAFRDAHPQDRRPSRSSATGSWPSPARLARLEARDSRPAANHRRSPRDSRRLPAGCSARADMSRKRS